MASLAAAAEEAIGRRERPRKSKKKGSTRRMIWFDGGRFSCISGARFRRCCPSAARLLVDPPPVLAAPEFGAASVPRRHSSLAEIARLVAVQDIFNAIRQTGRQRWNAANLE